MKYKISQVQNMCVIGRICEMFMCVQHFYLYYTGNENMKECVKKRWIFGGEEIEKINQKKESGCQGAQGATWGMLQIYFGAESRSRAGGSNDLRLGRVSKPRPSNAIYIWP